MPHVVLVLVESVNDYLHMLENQGYELILAPTPASRAEAIARHGARIDAVLTRG
ncbi:2-hydroxyacid dehydrogenase, partial [Pseudomonas sp. FSL A6-1183]|nr:2-hydroxyacid dehydrogenase [Pseudomonas sp. FSL A6-1183]